MAAGAAPHHAVIAARRDLDPAFQAEQGRNDELEIATAGTRAFSSPSAQPPKSPPLSPASSPQLHQQQQSQQPRCVGEQGLHIGEGGGARGGEVRGIGSQDSSTDDVDSSLRALLGMPAGDGDDEDFSSFRELLAVCEVTPEQLADEIMLAEASQYSDGAHAPLALEEPAGPSSADPRAAALQPADGSEHAPRVEPKQQDGVTTLVGGELREPMAELASPPLAPADSSRLATVADSWKQGSGQGNVRGGLRRYAGGGSARGGGPSRILTTQLNGEHTTTMALPFRFAPRAG
jgi:hypothetical protein